MSAQTAAALLWLLAPVAEPWNIPTLPHPDEGLLALWEWLRAVNSELSIPDPGFRWMFGGFSIPVLLLFELVGIRRDWKLYPFLLPFWLIFGSIALGVVGGVAAAAAHLVLFPVGRIWFMVRDRRRRPPAAAGQRAPPPADRAPEASAATAPPRTAQDALRAALQAIRAEARRAKSAPGGPGQAREPAQAILRVLSAALGAAAAPPPDRAPGRPPPLPPPLPTQHEAEATGAPPGKPDRSAFRPDMSRFRRRPPQG